MRAAIDPDCTRVHLLIVHDDNDVQMLQHSAHDDYSNHDIRIERVPGGLVVKIRFDPNLLDAVQMEPVEVDFDAASILSADVLEVKVVLLPGDRVEATVVWHDRN